MEKKIRIVGPPGKKFYQCNGKEAYVDGDAKIGYMVIISERNKGGRVLPTEHKTKNAAIKAAKAAVRR